MSLKSRVKWRRKKILAQLEELTDPSRWQVDLGIELRVVKQDLEGGKEVIPGKPPVTVLRTHHFGGLFDIRSCEWVGESKKRVVWYCSEAQERLLLHGEDLPNRLLVYGSRGSGKTRTLAMWLVLRTWEFLPLARSRRIAIGATAPTADRRKEIIHYLRELCPKRWYQFFSKDCVFVFASRANVELHSTHRRSSELGYSFDGASWVASACDEFQYSTAANGVIESRGRDAPRGEYKRFCTATAQESAKWRRFRDSLKKGWSIEKLLAHTNAFVWPEFFKELKEQLTPREYARIVLAEDVGPERMVYPTLSLTDNVRPIPNIGAEDVTGEILSTWNRRATILVGHDPGSFRDVSILLKAYKLPNQLRHAWFIVGEVVTVETTAEEHFIMLKRTLQRDWGISYPDPASPQALVRYDPHTREKIGSNPDRSIQIQGRNVGLDVRPGNFNGSKPARIPKEAGIEVISRLFRTADGSRRLFFACDSSGRPLAPKTLEAFSLSERDEYGRAEINRKTNQSKESDYSDFTAPVRYALWIIEKPRPSLFSPKQEVATWV